MEQLKVLFAIIIFVYFVILSIAFGVGIIFPAYMNIAVGTALISASITSIIIFLYEITRGAK